MNTICKIAGCKTMVGSRAGGTRGSDSLGNHKLRSDSVGGGAGGFGLSGKSQVALGSSCFSKEVRTTLMTKQVVRTSLHQ